MQCKDLESNAIAYLDGKLPAAQRDAMERHLTLCSACRERVEGFTQVMGVLDGWESVEPSPFFHTRLAARLAEEPVSQSWWSRLAVWEPWAPRPVAGSLFAIVFAVVVTVAVVLLRYSPTPTPIETTRSTAPTVTVAATGGDEMALYQELPLLEDWDVLRNFEVLQELPALRQVEGNNAKPVLQ